MATAFGEPLAPKQRQKTSVECEHCKKNGVLLRLEFSASFYEGSRSCR